MNYKSFLVQLLHRSETRISELSLLMHLAGHGKLTDSDFVMLDSCTADALLQMENVRLHIERDLED